MSAQKTGNENKRCNIRHNEIYFAHTAGNKKLYEQLITCGKFIQIIHNQYNNWLNDLQSSHHNLK